MKIRIFAIVAVFSLSGLAGVFAGGVHSDSYRPQYGGFSSESVENVDSYRKYYENALRFNQQVLKQLQAALVQYNAALAKVQDAHSRAKLKEGIKQLNVNIVTIKRQIQVLENALAQLDGAEPTQNTAHEFPQGFGPSQQPVSVSSTNLNTNSAFKPAGANTHTPVATTAAKPDTQQALYHSPENTTPKTPWVNNNAVYENAVPHSAKPDMLPATLGEHTNKHTFEHPANENAQAYQDSLFGTNDTVHGHVPTISSVDEKEQAEMMTGLGLSMQKNMQKTLGSMTKEMLLAVSGKENSQTVSVDPDLFSDVLNPDMQALEQTVDKTKKAHAAHKGGGVLYAGLKVLSYVAGKLGTMWAGPVSATLDQGAEVAYAGIKTVEHYKKKTGQGMWGSLKGEADDVYDFLNTEGKKLKTSAANDFYEMTVPDADGQDKTIKINATNPTIVQAGGQKLYVFEDEYGNPTGYVAKVDKKPFWKFWGKDTADLYQAEIETDGENYAIKNTKKLGAFKGAY